MFWGCEVSKKPVPIQESGEGDDLEMGAFQIHVTNAVLVTTKKTPAGASFKLFVETEDKKL